MTADQVAAKVLQTIISDTAVLAFIGMTLIAWGLYLKARVEERFLREQLGSAAYDAYARRVPMLVPHL
jgi:protein-S-isoprenylcysteine O-methyltransferase Ste14